MWDIFVSHASEDKDAIARPIAEALREAGLAVWFDEFTLTVGDSLRRSIERGISESRYGLVILSPAFFAKEWPKRELDGLTTIELAKGKTILPVWHKVAVGDVQAFSPTLADKLAITTHAGVEEVVHRVLQAMGRHIDRSSNRQIAANESYEKGLSLAV